MVDALDIAKIAGDRAFSNRLVTNVYRGLVVEAIVSAALQSDWKWCSEDYFQFDFLHSDGARLEVKQSAACQSWQSKIPSVARWDIAARNSVWHGDQWIVQPGRNADIYILGWHSVLDRENADHRDPEQWEFFVVRADALPPTKTMGIGSARKLAEPIGFDQLARTVSAIVAGLKTEAANSDQISN